MFPQSPNLDNASFLTLTRFLNEQTARVHFSCEKVEREDKKTACDTPHVIFFVLRMMRGNSYLEMTGGHNNG